MNERSERVPAVRAPASRTAMGPGGAVPEQMMSEVKVIVIGEIPGQPDLLTLRAEEELTAGNAVVVRVAGDPFLDPDGAAAVARLVAEGYEVEVVPSVGLAMAEAAAALRPLTTRHHKPWATIGGRP